MRTRHAGEERTVVRIEHADVDGVLLQTSVSGTLLALEPSTVRRALCRYPAMTLAVIARIHWQAVLLWTKRVGFRRKPLPPATAVTR